MQKDVCISIPNFAPYTQMFHYYCLVDIRLHVGASPLHSPVTRHSLVSSPTSLNPYLHLYVALSPTLLPVSLTEPYLGSSRSGHVMPAGYKTSAKLYSWWDVGEGSEISGGYSGEFTTKS